MNKLMHCRRLSSTVRPPVSMEFISMEPHTSAYEQTKTLFMLRRYEHVCAHVIIIIHDPATLVQVQEGSGFIAVCTSKLIVYGSYSSTMNPSVCVEAVERLGKCQCQFSHPFDHTDCNDAYTIR